MSAAAALLVMLGSLAAWINEHDSAPIGVVVSLLGLLS
ncbi:cytochrome c oxidase subunit 3, partial [Paraburkholderia sp. SIMBA_053]